MTDDSKNSWKSFTEEIEVGGHQLIERIQQLIAEGNVSRMRIRSKNDDVVLDVPLTAGAVVGGVVVLAAPWLAILGALAGLLAHARIEVARESAPVETPPPENKDESSNAA